MTLWGKKRTALFQTHNWEKSSFFSTLIRVYAWFYANTRQGGTLCRPSPDLIGLNLKIRCITLFIDLNATLAGKLLKISKWKSGRLHGLVGRTAIFSCQWGMGIPPGAKKCICRITLDFWVFKVK